MLIERWLVANLGHNSQMVSLKPFPVIDGVSNSLQSLPSSADMGRLHLPITVKLHLHKIQPISHNYKNMYYNKITFKRPQSLSNTVCICYRF